MVKNGYQYYIIMCDINELSRAASRGFGGCGGPYPYRCTLPSPVSTDTATVRSTTTLPRVCLEPALYTVSLPSYPGGSQVFLFITLSLPRSTAMTCPTDNSQVVDQSSFWSVGMHWDAHRIGWTIAGGCSALVRAISLCPKNLSSSFHSPNRRL
jgi:hypothetical protein